jgi:hypothetical protein
MNSVPSARAEIRANGLARLTPHVVESDASDLEPDFDDFGEFDDLDESGDGAEPPSFSPITLKPFDLPVDGRISVVGESYYQQALRIAARGRAAGSDSASHIPVTAALIPEPENPWDKNAVRVDIVQGDRSLKVGYLSSSLAEEYQHRFLDLRDRGLFGVCPARITGGGEGRYYGIYLHLVYPERYAVAVGDEDPEIARIEGSVAVLRDEWSCTVTKEEDHQGALRKHAPPDTSEYRQVVASLGFCEISSGKYKGQTAIEVRIEGQRVGQLTKAMTNRYHPVLNRVHERQLEPRCVAYVVRRDRGLEVELGMPRDPERKPRYS